MEQQTTSNEISLNSSTEPSPRFFQNSRTGTEVDLESLSLEETCLVDEGAEEPTGPRPGVKTIGGGFTCCVPRCFNNSKRDKHLKFYQFPSGTRAEKVELRKKWISLISRKDFTPTEGHRVCSEHFPGGQKTYMNNLPIIVPKSTRPTIPIPRTTTKARTRDPNFVLQPKLPHAYNSPPVLLCSYI